MPLRTNPVSLTLRLLFGAPRQDTLTAGGRRMGRRIVLFAIAAAILGGLGYGAFAFFTRTPDVGSVEAPAAPEIKGELPTSDQFEHLAKTDPVRMFEACLARYKREGIQGVSATLEKQERVKGTMNEREVVKLMCSGDVPDEHGNTPNLRVRMIWESGHRKVLGVKNLGSLYIAGANDNHMQVLTSLTTMTVDPKGAMPRGASRYCITDAGLYRGMLRTYDAWKKRQAAGELNATFLGIQTPKELDGRACFVVQRRCPNPEVDPFALDESADLKANPQRDGAAEVTAFIDIEHWLHIGTILKRADGTPLAEYWFRDVKPSKSAFEPNPFTMDSIKAAIKK
jgi:hypothetical protein